MDEVKRRNLTCEAELRYYRIDCSGLVLVSAQAVAANAYAATVQNRTEDSKRSVIVSGAIASEGFMLAPGQTQSYLITTSAPIASIASALSPGSAEVSLANCVSYR